MSKPSNASKRGPLEVIEAKGVKIPIYCGLHHGKSSYLISYYAEGKRVMERASTLGAAREQAKAKIRELTTGVAHLGSLTPRESAAVHAAADILKPTGVAITQAAREYAEAHKILDGVGSVIEAARAYVRDAARREIRPKRLSEVVMEFLEYIETTGLSWQYLRDCRARLERATAAFHTNIGDIEPLEIEAWLAQGKRGPRAFNNDRNTLVTLFNFAKKKGYLARDGQNAAELVGKRKDVGGEIQILTPEAYALLLANTPEAFLPYVALGGLAGLRTSEISRLDWREVDFAQGHILITAAKAKTASRRIVPMCDALKAWLLPIAKPEGRIMPYANEQSMMNRWSELKARMMNTEGKPIVEVPTNSLRHSYASYRLAQIEDAAKVALECGNSPRKLFSNYRQLATKAKAEQFFSIFPTPAVNVLSIASAVAA